MDTGETGTTEALEKEVQERCPFKESEEGVDSDDDESIGDDDDDDVQDEQENDGGTLGRNLVAGSHGAGGTVGGPCDPTDYTYCSPQEKTTVYVPESDEVDADVYPVAIAAHCRLYEVAFRFIVISSGNNFCIAVGFRIIDVFRQFVERFFVNHGIYEI